MKIAYKIETCLSVCRVAKSDGIGGDVVGDDNGVLSSKWNLSKALRRRFSR